MCNWTSVHIKILCRISCNVQFFVVFFMCEALLGGLRLTNSSVSVLTANLQIREGKQGFENSFCVKLGRNITAVWSAFGLTWTQYNRGVICLRSDLATVNRIKRYSSRKVNWKKNLKERLIRFTLLEIGHKSNKLSKVLFEAYLHNVKCYHVSNKQQREGERKDRAEATLFLGKDIAKEIGFMITVITILM